MVISSGKVRWLLGLSAGAILVFLATNALYALGLIGVVRFLWGATVSAVLIGVLAMCREEEPGGAQLSPTGPTGLLPDSK